MLTQDRRPSSPGKQARPVWNLPLGAGTTCVGPALSQRLRWEPSAGYGPQAETQSTTPRPKPAPGAGQQAHEQKAGKVRGEKARGRLTGSHPKQETTSVAVRVATDGAQTHCGHLSTHLTTSQDPCSILGELPGFQATSNRQQKATGQFTEKGFEQHNEVMKTVV